MSQRHRHLSEEIFYDSLGIGIQIRGEPNPRLARCPRIWLPTFDIIILEAIAYKVHGGIQIRAQCHPNPLAFLDEGSKSAGIKIRAYTCTCKCKRQTRLGPCSPSSSRLRVLLRSHHYRQKNRFLLYRYYYFQKTNELLLSLQLSAIRGTFVDSWRDDSSSLLLLSLEIAGVPKKLLSSDGRYWRTLSSTPTMTLAEQLKRRACLQRLLV